MSTLVDASGMEGVDEVRTPMRTPFARTKADQPDLTPGHLSLCRDEVHVELLKRPGTTILGVSSYQVVFRDCLSPGKAPLLVERMSSFRALFMAGDTNDCVSPEGVGNHPSILLERRFGPDRPCETVRRTQEEK